MDNELAVVRQDLSDRGLDSSTPEYYDVKAKLLLSLSEKYQQANQLDRADHLQKLSIGASTTAAALREVGPVKSHSQIRV